MAILDRNVGWKRHWEFIPAPHFNSLELAEGTPNTLQGTLNGAPVLQEVSTLGMTGVRMDALTELQHIFLMVPEHWDVSQTIQFKAVYTADSISSGDTLTFTGKYKAIAKGEAIAVADTALSTAIPEHTLSGTTAYSLQETAAGILNGGILSQGGLMAFSIGPTADTGLDVTSDVMIFLGIRIGFMPDFCVENI